MTCLLALESGKKLSGVVTIGTLPADDFAADSSNIGLKKGEKIKFSDLLAGMMVKSGNDAADAVAIHVAGTVDKFITQMNKKAQALGMTGTHYTCTNGLTNSTDHYTTAKDMAILAMAAVKDPEFRKLVSLTTVTIPPTNKTKKARNYTSTNELLNDEVYGYTYATGIKTGYMSIAKNCFVSSASKDGRTLIAVDMHVEVRSNMWTDSITMFEYGFNFFETVKLNDVLAGQKAEIKVKDAANDDIGNGSLTLTLKPQGEAWITGRKNEIQGLCVDSSQMTRELIVTKDTAPIICGETVGTVTYYYEDKPVLTCDLIASRSVAKLATPAPTVSAAATPSPAASSPAQPTPEKPAATPVPVPRSIIETSPWFIGLAIAVLVFLLVAAILIITRKRIGKHSAKTEHNQ